MKTFPIVVEFPDEFKEEDVLYNIMSNLDFEGYEKVGIRFKTNPVLTAKYQRLMETLGLISVVQPSKIKT